MQVILIKDVDTLGENGQLMTVKDGFARNYLFPRNLAVEATTGAVQDRDRRLSRIQAKAEKKHQEDLAKAGKVEALGQLVLKARAGEHGKLFGAVTTKELARLITEKTGLPVERKSLALNSPINRLGDYEVSIRFSPKVTSKLPVQVLADDDEQQDLESELI